MSFLWSHGYLLAEILDDIYSSKSMWVSKTLCEHKTFLGKLQCQLSESIGVKIEDLY